MKKFHFALFGVVLFLASCQKKAGGPPPATPAPVVAHAANGLEQGEAFFQAREYGKAAAAFESYLAAGPNKKRDQVLFQLGLAYELSGRDRDKGTAAFRKLVQEFPQSEWLEEAQVMLALQSEIEKLRAENNTREEQIGRLRRELEKLKRIDLEKKPGKP